MNSNLSVSVSEYTNSIDQKVQVKVILALFDSQFPLFPKTETITLGWSWWESEL